MVLEEAEGEPASGEEVGIAIQRSKTQGDDQQQQDRVLPLVEVCKNRKKCQTEQNRLPDGYQLQPLQRVPQQHGHTKKDREVDEVPRGKGMRVWQERQWQEKQCFKGRVDIGQG